MDPHHTSNCLPAWEVAELPEPKPLKWEHWTRFVGPGIVMMGIQIGGGEWLLGPDITAKYGGGADVDRDDRDHLPGVLQPRMRQICPVLR